jgi:hypothetical protein
MKVVRLKLFLLLCLIFSFVFIFFVDAQAQQRQRERVAQAGPVAEVTVTLKEDFFAAFFESLFANLKAPSYQISKSDAKEKSASEAKAAHASSTEYDCPSVIRLEREIGGVKTAVRFQNGKIVAPIAFSGDYNASLFGCINFQGWADTVVSLQFDKEKQSLKARVDVQNINLNNVPSLANGILVKLVQKEIDQKINPVEILKAEQLSTTVPVKNSGSLKMKAKEVRHEITQGSMSIHIIYEFERG